MSGRVSNIVGGKAKAFGGGETFLSWKIVVLAVMSVKVSNWSDGRFVELRYSIGARPKWSGDFLYLLLLSF
jgi:hypothetical protein